MSEEYTHGSTRVARYGSEGEIPDHNTVSFLGTVITGEKGSSTVRNPLLSGTLGNIEIESVLGAGGFGTVYKAKDQKLGRDVAVKFLTQRMDGRYLELFQREARVIAALGKHPNIVQIFEYGEYDQHPYFVLEYVPTNASKLIASSPEGLPVDQAVRIAAECAEALAYAHKHNVLHRDVKPANILIEKSNGSVKLADFGLAKLQDSGENTEMGLISGSPPYMSPEQANGEELDERSDIFSLGITLYELLCGRRPFEGSSTSEILTNIRHGKATPLTDRKKDLPAAIYKVVEKATALDPKHRYPTAEILAKDLRKISQNVDAPTTIDIYAGTRVPHLLPLLKKWGWAPIAGACVAGALIFLWPIILERLGLDNSAAQAEVVRRASTAIREGDLAKAEQEYRDVLQQDSNNRFAYEGLVYVLAKQGKFSELDELLPQIHDKTVRAGAIASEAVHSGQNDARNIVEDQMAANDTPYMRVLLAKLDIAQENAEAARARLEELDLRSFSDDWQRVEYWQTLARTYSKLNLPEEADATLAKLKQMGGSSSFIDGLSSVVAEKKQAKTTDVQTLLADIRRRIDAGEIPVVDYDKWTSRPITFWIMPTATSSEYVRQNEVMDVFSTKLSEALSDERGFEPVSRALLEAVLQEQQLGAYLSSDRQIQLQQVVGARLLVRPEIKPFMDDLHMYFVADDAETMRPLQAKDVEVPKDLNLDAMVTAAESAIREQIRKKYPLQGRLFTEEGVPRLNIGSLVGVEKGAVFELIRNIEESEEVIGTAIVEEAPGQLVSKVTLEGVNAEELPNDASAGWYARLSKAS